MDALARLEQSLQPFTESLAEALLEVSAEIAQRERELSELRQARRRVLSLRKTLDPSLNARRASPARDFSQASYEQMLDWLQANREQINAGIGIYAGGLHADPDFTLVRDKSRLSKMLARAHEEGILRIDSMGRGSRKNYKVV
jgi:hypothetical protein